jgi:hypothetical protein
MHTLPHCQKTFVYLLSHFNKIPPNLVICSRKEQKRAAVLAHIPFGIVAEGMFSRKIAGQRA